MANILHNRRQLLKGAGVLGGLAALLSPATALFAQPNTNTPTIGGSWQVHVTPQGSGTPSPFQALHTFTGDGALTTSEQRDQVAPRLKSSGHGSWVKVPSTEDDFVYSYKKLVVDTQGNLLGTQNIKIKIELAKDGQSFTGTGTSVFQPAQQPPDPDYVFRLTGSRL